MSNTDPVNVNGPGDLPALCLVPEVAQFFRQTDETIRGWIKKGSFPNAFKTGRNYLIPKQDVLDLAHRMYGKR